MVYSMTIIVIANPAKESGSSFRSCVVSISSIRFQSGSCLQKHSQLFRRCVVSSSRGTLFFSLLHYSFYIYVDVNQMLGKCNFKNGQVYDGEWRNDKANGRGMIIFSHALQNVAFL